MAAISCEEAKSHFTCIVDGKSNLPVNYSCFQLIEPSFDEADKLCSLDVFPIVVEDSLPMTEKCSLNSSDSQDVYSLSVLPDEGNAGSQCASQLTVLSFLEVPLTSNNQMCLDARVSCQNCFDFDLEGADTYPPCIVNINVEKENTEIVKPNDEAVVSMKTDGIHLPKVLQRQASLNVEKSFNERVHDAPVNRWRRYKRAASFDSRKIVLLFSIVSSLGTLTLIYLTLRVRQAGDGFNHA